MRKTKTYQNNSPLEYGFILSAQQQYDSLADICYRAKSSITLVDTNDYVLSSFLRNCVEILNNRDIVVAGVVNKAMLASLKGKGVVTGFFRSTDEFLGLGLLIIDKREAWACFGEGRVLRIVSGSEEIFQFANHLLWAKTDKEYSFGMMRDVRQTMMSVIMPAPSDGIPQRTRNHDYATSPMAASRGLIANQFEGYSQPAIVMPLDCAAFLDQDKLFVEILPGAFYEVDGGKKLEQGISFDPNHAKPADLLGKMIRYKGEERRVIELETINETISVPVDEVGDYEPDFDSIYAKRKEISISTEVDVEILPMRRDGSYQLSPNYKTRQQISEQIQSGLDRLEKLGLGKDVDRQIHSVRTEKSFEEQVRLYNKLVSGLDFGIDALKNKKSNFPTINQSADSFAVPHELLGTLLAKGKNRFLALKDEGYVEEAKAWLRGNGLEATLILDSKE